MTAERDAAGAAWAAAHAAYDLAGDRLEQYVERLRAIIEIDTGPDAPEGRESVAARLARWAQDADFHASLHDTPEGSHLVIRLAGPRSARRVVLLGHHDTVFERGSAERLGFHRRGDRLLGPGVADMKGGLLTALLAMQSLAASPHTPVQVELHSVPDEETRSWPLPRMDLLRGAAAVLVLECGRENGDLVVGRKAAAWLHLHAKGRSAHAGTEPERGSSALLALCREILRCDRLNGARRGLSVVTATMSSGTFANVVPERAEAELDVRAMSAEDRDWALAEIAHFGPSNDVLLSLDVDGRVPGIEPTPANHILFDEARRLAAGFGQGLDGQTSGGSSDGCWTADAGIPTLDGLGPVGGADHSPDEFIALSSVPLRCGIIAGLCGAVGQGLLDRIREEPREG